MKARRIRIAAAVAIAAAADATQVLLFPLFAEGALSPLNNAVDVVVGVVLTALLGWHWVFLPSFLTEMVPGLDLAPTWTAAALWAAWRTKKHESPAPVNAKQADLPPTSEKKSLG